MITGSRRREQLGQSEQIMTRSQAYAFEACAEDGVGKSTKKRKEGAFRRDV